MTKFKRYKKGLKSNTYLIGTLDHALLPLHLDVLLLLGVGQRPRDTNQESAGTDNPQGLAAEGQTGLAEGCERRNGVGDGAARGGRDHVFQGGDTLVEGFVLEDFLFFVGDFRFCFLWQMMLDTVLMDLGGGGGGGCGCGWGRVVPSC